jgi:hypothetical protein
MNPRNKSYFARTLIRLLDETRLFTRKEWGDLLGVSASAVSQWLSDATVPRPDHLYMVFDTLKGSDVPEEPLDDFRQMAEKPATAVSPHGKRMLPTVWAYMTRPAFDTLSNRLAKLNVKEQEQLLEKLFDDKSTTSGETTPAFSHEVLVPKPSMAFNEHKHWKCLLSPTVPRCPDHGKAGEPGSGFIRPLFRIMTAGDELGPELRWEDLRQHPRVVLVSQPGCGKSTVLRQLAREIQESLPTADSPSSVPIYMHLSCLATIITGSDLQAVVRERITNPGHPNHLFLLLDGLDEVQEDARVHVLGSVSSFLSEYPRTNVVITSRPTLRELALEGFTRLGIEPFSYVQVKRWMYHRLASRYWSREPQWSSSIDKYFYELRERPDVLSVLRIPLFLAVSTGLFARNSVTPFYASDILSQCVSMLLDEWDRKRNVFRTSEPWGTPNHMLKILSSICFHSLKGEQQQFTTSKMESWLRDLPYDAPLPKVLKVLAESSGVLAACPGDEWRITHKTMQDFLAAVYIVESCRDVHDLLKREVGIRSFQQAIRFALGITNDGSQLLEFILETDQLEEGPRMVLLADVLAQPFIAKHAIVTHSCDAVVRWLEPSFSNWVLESPDGFVIEEDLDRRWCLGARSNQPKPSLESQPGQYARQVLKSIHLGRSGPARGEFLDRLRTSEVPVLRQFGNCIDVEGRFRDHVLKDRGSEVLVAEVVETT